MPHKDPEARRAYYREYERKNRKKKREQKRELYRRNCEQRREKARAWYAAHRESKRAYYLKNREAIKKKRRAFRKKHRAKLSALRVAAYWLDVDASRARERARYPKRQEQHRAYCRAYYQMNRKERLAINIAYGRAHADERRAAMRARYWENRDRVLAKGREWRETHGKEWSRAYAKKHPDRIRLYNAKGRGKRRALLRSVRIGDQEAITAYYRRVYAAKSIRCYWCKLAIPAGKRTVDHLTPLCRGGAHCVTNFAPCCKSCNSRKKHRTPAEFKAYLRKIGKLVTRKA